MEKIKIPSHEELEAQAAERDFASQDRSNFLQGHSIRTGYSKMKKRSRAGWPAVSLVTGKVRRDCGCE